MCHRAKKSFTYLVLGPILQATIFSDVSFQQIARVVSLALDERNLAATKIDRALDALVFTRDQMCFHQFNCRQRFVNRAFPIYSAYFDNTFSQKRHIRNRDTHDPSTHRPPSSACLIITLYRISILLELIEDEFRTR